MIFKMTKEEKRRIKWLISAITRDWKGVLEAIDSDGASAAVVARLKYLQETFYELEKRLKESGVLK